jgi:hypothetical protein
MKGTIMANREKPVTTKVTVQKLSVKSGHRVPNATVPSASRTPASSSAFRRGGATTDTSWRRK